MDEDQEQLPEPKISTPEIVLIGGIFIIFDLIEIVLLFFVLDDFWIIDIIAATIFFYLLIKGVPPMRQLICWLIELIPWLGALPLLTIGWGLTVWADRHPSSALAKVGELVATTRGRGGVAPPGIQGAGARSLQRIERAEERAAQWSNQPSLGNFQGGEDRGAVAEIGRGGQPTLPKENQSLAGMLGEKENEFQRLDARLYPKQFEDIPRMAAANDNDGVEVGDDGLVDLRQAA